MIRPPWLEGFNFANFYQILTLLGIFLATIQGLKMRLKSPKSDWISQSYKPQTELLPLLYKEKFTRIRIKVIFVPVPKQNEKLVINIYRQRLRVSGVRYPKALHIQRLILSNISKNHWYRGGSCWHGSGGWRSFGTATGTLGRSTSSSIALAKVLY